MALKQHTFLAFIFHFFTATGLLIGLGGWAAWYATHMDLEPLMYVAIAGGGIFALGLLGELILALGALSSRRGAVGANVLFQVLLAAGLLVAVNTFSLSNYARWDWTAKGEFTIPKDVREKLSRLRSETTIVVLQRHTPFGQIANKQDNYDAAAERKIVQKVKDLVDLFREVDVRGPKFHVEFLDNQSDKYQEKLTAIRKKSPELATAIEEAPENSIFFYVKDPKDKEDPGSLQRLSFHDIYQLDKEASRAANDGKGNLVLNYQGLEPFVRKILDIEEKRPRIAVGVIHQLLGQKSDHLYFRMDGMAKALQRRGFDSFDVVLKTNWDMGQPEPAVLTYDENEYQRLEAQEATVETAVDDIRTEIRSVEERRKKFRSLAIDELNKEFTLVRTFTGLSIVSRAKVEEFKKRTGQTPATFPIDLETKTSYLGVLDEVLADLATDLERQTEELQDLRSQKSSLNIEELAERKRITDLHAKFKRLLDESDMLILPRVTWFDAIAGEGVPPRLHHLHRDQVRAIKDFIKEGKPVLFCLGPINETERMAANPESPVNSMEEMLKEIGFHLPKQTVLFNVESKAIAEQRVEILLGRSQVETPPVRFEWKRSKAEQFGKEKKLKSKPHPVLGSLQLTASGFGEDKEMAFSLRNPRPVYLKELAVSTRDVAMIVGSLAVSFVNPGEAPVLFNLLGDVQLKKDAVLLWSDPESWNETSPFLTEENIPKLDRGKSEDLEKVQFDSERPGPFPIAAAIETKLPTDWFEGDEPPTVRLAVIGQGLVFTGAELKPMQEKLLLDVTNWLLGRDDLLIQRDETPWRFPRVPMTDQEKNLWQWGMRLGLPALFAYFGVFMFLVRRMR